MSSVETDPPAKAERHLAAILACDVVRSSWHMERKEEETIGRLRDLRQNLIQPKVSEHRGRVFKTMGDGFLAEFVSALDAVHCAVDIQRLMAERNLDLPEDERLELRIGINLGDVFREGDDVFGDGVNVAARLENAAPPGGIRVSRSVCDPIRDRFSFDFDDLGEHQFHNITRPIHVFGVRLDGEGPPPSPPSSVPARRSVGRPFAAAAVLMMLVLGVSIWWGGAFDRSPRTTASIPVQPPAAPTPAPAPQPTVNAETVFWQSISSSNNAADFQEYLRKYPNGEFAGLARNRLAALRSPAVVHQLLPAPTSPPPAPRTEPCPHDIVGPGQMRTPC